MKNQLRFRTNSSPEVRDEEKRIVKFIISDETIDRHGTILDMDGWELDNFNKNGIVGYQHDVYGSFFGESNPDSVIGKGRAFIEGEGKDRKLMGEVEFEPADINPLADKIFKKVGFGTLKATSVGFLPLEKGEFKEVKCEGCEKEEVYYYGKRELLEFSVVNIPSNPNAVKRTFELEEKNIDIEQEEFTEENVKKLELAFKKNEDDEKNSDFKRVGQPPILTKAQIEKNKEKKNKSLQLQKQLISLHEHSL